MRLRTRLLLTTLLLLGIGAAAGFFVARRQLVRQWNCHRVAVASSFAEARQRIAWFETGADRGERLGELVAKWDTGNPRFDRYLAQYIDDPDSSEALREAFSLEFAWRPASLSRWAHYWSRRPGMAPERRVASIVAYLDDLSTVAEPPPLTWREVLDLQAVFQLTGNAELAGRLKPTNWPKRYRRWREANPDNPPHIARPADPLPD